jgi:hypothetical protein
MDYLIRRESDRYALVRRVSTADNVIVQGVPNQYRRALELLCTTYNATRDNRVHAELLITAARAANLKRCYSFTLTSTAQ